MNREELLTIRRLFDGHRLELARELQGLLKSELAAKMHLSPAAISQFEANDSKPNPGTIGELSLVLGVPPAFFAAGRPSIELAETDVHFRSLRSTSKKHRTQARAQVRLLAEAVGVLSRQVRLPEVDLPEYQLHASPDEVAADLRRLWDLGDGPIADVTRLLERHGVVVVKLLAATDELDAFSCWVDGQRRPYVVLTTNKQASDRSRFDVAHELYHLIAHQDASPGDPVLEKEAQRFAAAFLLPEPAMRKELPSRVLWQRFADLKLRWGVSMQALLYRARDLRIITDVAYQRAWIDMSRRKWRTDEPVQLPIDERPELLRRAIQLLHDARNYGIEDLAADVAVPASALEPFWLTLAGDALPEVAL